MKSATVASSGVAKSSARLAARNGGWPNVTDAGLEWILLKWL